MKNKIINLMGSAILCLLLVGCGENPMLDPKMMLALENSVTQHSSLKDRVSCVEYGTNPSMFSLRQPYCSQWMQNQYTNYVGQISSQVAAASIGNASSTQKSSVAIPTFEQFTDPKVWQILWSEDGEKWKQELMTKNTVPVVTTPVINQVKKAATAAQPKPLRKPVPKICRLYPQSLACFRVKRAIASGLINN